MLVERNIAMRAGKSLLDKPCYIEWNPFTVGAMKLFTTFIVHISNCGTAIAINFSENRSNQRSGMYWF
jgi:hypothetical protein